MSATQRLTSNLAHVVVVAVLLLLMASYFVPGGIPAATEVGQLISFSRPGAIIMATLLLFRIQIDQFRKGVRIYQPIIYFVSFIAVTLLASVIGYTTTLYVVIRDMFYNYGTAAVAVMTFAAHFSAIFRSFTARRASSGFMMIMFFISIMAFSVVGDMVFPPITELGRTIWASVSSGCAGGMWLASYLGLAALTVRVLLFQERLRPR
jgi:hypothetical protein